MWCLLDQPDMESARKALQQREGITGNGLAGIGSEPPQQDRTYAHADTVSTWLREKSLDCVVWTALSPNFGEQGNSAPDLTLVIEHLQGLPIEQQRAAEEYVRRAPSCVQTPMRAAIEAHFGWTPSTAA